MRAGRDDGAINLLDHPSAHDVAGQTASHNEPFQTLTFGSGGDSRSEELFGWSAAEDGFTWTDGRSAGVRLLNPVSEFGFYVELYCWPNRLGGSMAGQAVILGVNGARVGEGVVTGRARLAWHVLPQVGTYICLQIDVPGACRPRDPNDARMLGCAVHTVRTFVARQDARAARRRLAAMPLPHDDGTAIELAQRMTGLPVRELSMEFESLGANCELGFFQRACGAEPLGLLRFSGQPIFSLVAGLDERLRHLGDEAALDPCPEETDVADWVMYERRYLLRYHTWVRLDEATREQMIRREAKKVRFLRDKLIRDMEEGGKIFVHQEQRHISLAEILPLFLALRRVGPGDLVWICPEDAQHPAGLVEQVHPGLYRASFSRFREASSGAMSMPDWLTTAAAAFMLARRGIDR